MEEQGLTKKEITEIVNESADEFTKEVIEEVDNMSEEEIKKIDDILAIEDPTERMKEVKKLYPNIDGIGMI